VGEEETQPVGWPPDWADDTAEPRGHGPAPVTPPESVFWRLLGPQRRKKKKNPSLVSFNFWVFDFLGLGRYIEEISGF
jgi:hypothetical protein